MINSNAFGGRAAYGSDVVGTQRVFGVQGQTKVCPFFFAIRPADGCHACMDGHLPGNGTANSSAVSCPWYRESDRERYGAGCTGCKKQEEINSMKRTVIMGAALALAAALLSGCGQGTLETTAADTAVSAKAGNQTAESGGSLEEKTVQTQGEEYGTVVIRNGDRTVTFTEMPQKVFCCHLYAAENMVMLGLEDYIAGKNVPASAAEEPLPELAEAFSSIPEVERSHENVVALGTDLVIGQVSAFRDTGWGSYEQFENKGINCLAITGTLVQDETVEDVYTDIENLGKIFKVEDRAEELIARIRSEISQVQEAVKNVPEEQRVRAFVLDTFNGNEIYTTSSGLESNLIELAGGENVTKGMSDSRWFNTSVETLVEANPDVIILNDYGTQTIEEKLDFLNSNPALQEVEAVKNQAYLTIPLVAVMQDVRAASACRTFGEYFYPECFQ